MWRNGIRGGLKHRWAQALVGSSPTIPAGITVPVPARPGRGGFSPAGGDGPREAGCVVAQPALDLLRAQPLTGQHGPAGVPTDRLPGQPNPGWLEVEADFMAAWDK